MQLLIKIRIAKYYFALFYFFIFFLSGGLFVGLPEEAPRSAILSEAELQYYIQQYRKSGFRYTGKAA